MSNVRNIAILVGSLRKDSFSRKVALNLIELAPKSLKLSIAEIGDLPLYNQDCDDNNQVPAQWGRFRDDIRNVHGVLFVTPEYNRSVPAPLKNAIDVGSRPYAKSVWGKKPGGVISVSPSPLGGFGANHHLRQSLVALNVLVLQQPEAYIGGVDKVLDGSNKLVDRTRDFMNKYLELYAQWVEKHIAVA